MRHILVKGLMVTCGAFALLATAAQADDKLLAGSQVETQLNAPRAVGVKNRPRPGYDAVGIRAGAFMIYPTAAVSETYDDNIYAADTGKQDDFITKVGAGVNIQSNWSRHSLSVYGNVDHSFYADHSDENQFNWNVGTRGAIDITRDTQITGGLSYAQLHEDRGEPNAITGAKDPTKYNLLVGEAALSHNFNRILTKVSGKYLNYNYHDNETVLSVPIDEDFRDRQQYEESLRLGYIVSPDTNIYLEGTLNQRDYRLRPPFPGITVDRNSDGYAAVVGSEFRITNVMQGEVFAGYQKQTYDAVGFKDASGVRYGASVNWFVTELTTVRFDALSSIEETITPGASGIKAQSGRLSVDHELLRNLILSGDASYGNENYAGSPREDNVWRAGIGLDYLLNRNFSVGAEYRYTNRDSNIATSSYKRNTVGLTLTGKL